MKKGDKCGQFYLIAAVIIIAILIGFASIVNYSRQKTSTRLSDIREELKIESEKVLDYETYNEDNKMHDFLTKYSDHLGAKIDLYTIYGNTLSQECNKYVGGVNVSHACPLSGNNINMTVSGSVYGFELKSGKNFYFVFSQDINGEQHILAG